MRVMLWLFRALSCALLGFSLFTAVAAQPRPFQVNDLFEMEGIGHGYGGPYAFSPDGEALAFTRLRPRKTLTNHQRGFLVGNDRGDVWLQTRPGQPSINLTNGLGTHSGWWAPQWSPDGRWLALLSTRGEGVTLWGWEKSSGKLVQLTPDEVELRDYDRPPFLWISATQLLCPTSPPRQTPAAIEGALDATPKLAAAGWAEAALGERTTASVLKSGVAVDTAARPPGQLVLIDVATGRSQVLTKGSTAGWTRAPNGGAVAFAKQIGVYVPKADESPPLRRVTPTAALGVYTVEIHFPDAGAAIDTAAFSKDVRTESLRWSPDGRELAFLGFGEARSEGLQLFRVDVKTRQVRRVQLGEIDPSPAAARPPQLEWLSSRALLVMAARKTAGEAVTATSRRDWWRVAEGSPPRSVTASMPAVPQELWRQRGSDAFVGLAGGAVWQINARTGAIVNLTQALDTPVEEILWPRTPSWDDSAEYPLSGRSYSDILFLARHDGRPASYRLGLASRTMSRLDAPGPDALVAAFAPATNSVVQSAASSAGTTIWRTGPASRQTAVLMTANTFLGQVAGGEMRSIEYRSHEGKQLRAWLLLPRGYERGKRYPLITWVHAGFIAGPEPPYWHTIAYADALNMHIPAAQGYAVLLPSMPVKARGEADEVMLGLTNGVLPAVDAAVDLGIADADRVFVAGHSFGGFSTYGLIAQTPRFKAAVSLAGMSNLISLYGAFDASLRYGEAPHENLTNIARSESGQNNLGAPPWRDVERYLRNSPIFYVERMQTPLMIVQGDLDFVPLQQGEELFMALYRLGKRAQFVRYWGEGHETYSPANIRDLWSRTFAWFDELGDIARDTEGRMIFDGDRVQSRQGAAPWTPQQFLELQSRQWKDRDR